jgi:hypothetical protein
LLTTILNTTEIAAISSLLKPWPAFHHAFSARTDKLQRHVSWPLNPKTRAFYGLPMLTDAEFSRTAALAIMHPFTSPRTCSCGHPIDPVGFHLLHCKQTHYGCLHDRVKHAIAGRIRSFMHSDVAAFSVLVEQPMLNHFGLRNAALPEGEACIADLIVSMHSELQQEPIACDFVSCFASTDRDYPTVLDFTARFKRRKYFKYNTIAENSFFPLPFGRTNVLSPEVLRFCTIIGNYMPPHMRASDKLLASFSRAIYSGVAQTFNIAVRRLQLSAPQRHPLTSLPHSCLRDPYATEPRTRITLSRRPPFADVPFVDALIAALAAPVEDAARVPSKARYRGSVAGGR